MDTKRIGEKVLVEHDEINSSQNGIVLNSVEENFILFKEINLPIINAVEFCSNILSRNGLGSYLPITKFECYQHIAETEVKDLVNAKDNLMKILSMFPLIFHVEGDQVTSKIWFIFHRNQQEWLKELLPNSYRQLPIYISTVQFYCNELFKLTPRFELPVHQLFSHKSKAPETIKVVTKNIDEFALFLQRYPEIFIFEGDKVLLSTSAVSYKSLKSWITRLLIGDLTFTEYVEKEERTFGCTALSGIKFYEVLKHEVAVYETLGIFFKIILNGPTKGVSLQKLFSKNVKVPMSSVFIRNITDLEFFIASYPEVFTIINKNIFLTQLSQTVTYTDPNMVKEDQFNCSGSKNGDIDPKFIEESAVSFYLDILHNVSSISGKITEFPISHLIYYSIDAPPEVKKIVKNAKELKDFLLQYPEIFRVNNADNIILDEIYVSSGISTKKLRLIDSTVSEKKVEQKLKEAISFFSNIIYELGGTAKIQQLLDYRSQASKEVQSITTSLKDLEKFFCSQNNYFSVVNDQVCLINKHIDDLQLNTPNIIPKQKAMENAISFYSNILRNHKKKKVIKISDLIGYKGLAPVDVQKVAKNPKKLQKIFSQFPEVFTIVDGFEVMLSDFCENSRSIQQEQTYSPEICNDDSHMDAVEFFSKMLSHYGICRVLSINKLFELKLKSSPSVQKISGSNINQFKTFLMKFPKYFIVTNANVIGRKKIPKCSYSGKYEDKKFIDPLLSLIFNFFMKYTSNKSLFHIDYLYNNAGKFFLYNNEKPVFQSKSDLLLFLGLYPHIFFVDYYRIVNVMASSKIAAARRREFKFKKQNNKNISVNNKPSPPNRVQEPIVQNSKLPHSLSSASLDVETKPLSDEIEESNSNEINMNIKDAKNRTPTYPKKGMEYRTRKRRKAKISTRTARVVQSSISDESLVSEPSKNYDEEREAEINSVDCLELDNFWDDQYSPCWMNDQEVEFKPSKIDEIENSIFSNFIDMVNKNFHLSRNEDNAPPHSDKICSDQYFRHIASSIFPKDVSRREDFNVLITDALMFLNDKLWEEGDLKIVTIEELFNSFSQSGLELRNYCCKSLKEFNDVLSKFPDNFIISQNKVMARKNKIQKVNYLLNNEEQSIPLALFNFLNSFTKQFNYILIRVLYSQVGKYLCNINHSLFFKSLRDMVLFLEMFPEVFYIDNNQIINRTASKENANHKVKFNISEFKLDSFFDKKLFSINIHEKFPAVPESTEGWKDYVLQRTIIVEDLIQCKEVTAELLKSEKVIALDCEGVNLGATGRLTLVQIGLMNGQVYIFDIIKDTLMVNEGGLKDLFESESIIKVIHDSKNDVANLYTEYGVVINLIFDTRVANHLIINKGVGLKKISNRTTGIGFNELCTKYGANVNVQKDEMKDVYKCNQSFWMDRPLTKNMIAYAALDVASLVPQIFSTMLKQLKGIPEKLVWELSRKHSLSVLNNMGLLFD